MHMSHTLTAVKTYIHSAKRAYCYTFESLEGQALRLMQFHQIVLVTMFAFFWQATLLHCAFYIGAEAVHEAAYLVAGNNGGHS